MERLMAFLKHLSGIVYRGIEIKKIHGWAGIKRQLYRVLSTSKDRNNYHHWVDRYDTLTDVNRRKIIKHVQSFSNKPRISIVIAVNHSTSIALGETISSICSQLYSHWELYITHVTAADLSTHKMLENYTTADNRIKIISYKNNISIAQAINSALEQTTGEYITIVEQDGKLSEHALFWFVDTINKHPNIKLIYSDEDQIDRNSSRINPYFKCDWNLDLFLSQNIIGHLAIYQTDLMREAGGYRDGFENEQGYDLALRYIEKITPDQIFHIPRVLYHCSMQPKDTQLLMEKKPSATLSGEKAISDYLIRNKICASAQQIGHGYRVRYKIQQPYPLVSLIIPTRNGYQLLRKCITSILEKTTYQNYQIIIVDNGSDHQETLSYLEQLNQDHRIQILRDDGPFNHSALNNAAVQIVQGSIIGLINNDVEVISEHWMEEMVSHVNRPEVGAVGARLWYPDHSLQHGGMILGIGWSTGHSHKGIRKGDIGYFGRAALIQSFSALTGACLFVRKALYEKVGGLDEDDFPTDYNDVDLCLKLLSLGYRNIWTPYAQLYHHESATRGPHNTKEKRQRFIKASANFSKKWGDIVLQDPAYSPNLTLDSEDYALAWPPRSEKI